jgi:hypothetical protein
VMHPVPMRVPEIQMHMPSPAKQVVHVTLKAMRSRFQFQKSVIGHASFGAKVAVDETGERRDVAINLTNYDGKVSGRMVLKLRVQERGVIVENWVTLGQGARSLADLPTLRGGVPDALRRPSLFMRSASLSATDDAKSSLSQRLASRIRMGAGQTKPRSPSPSHPLPPSHHPRPDSAVVLSRDNPLLVVEDWQARVERERPLIIPPPPPKPNAPPPSQFPPAIAKDGSERKSSRFEIGNPLLARLRAGGTSNSLPFGSSSPPPPPPGSLN